ncbi:unnamed protein product, partial [Lymnaea stagnalis]
IPKQPPLRYIRPGDVNIGGIISGLQYDKDGLCGDSSFIDSSFHFSESVVFAIEEINRNLSILPNVTLGFAILDDCMKETTSAIHAISFIKDAGGSLLGSSPNGTVTAQMSHEVEDILPSYDVVGVIGCLRSSNSMAASTVLGPAHLPLVSFTSTSETLSDKELYPYFLRVVPSDNYLVDALVELISHFQWSYISVLYAEGSFGEIAFQALRSKVSKMKGVCIATSHKIYQKASYEDHLWIMKDLLAHKNARVVVTFTDPPSVLQLLKASRQLGTSGWYIWLTNDSWKLTLGDITDKSVAGSFVVGFQSPVSQEYNRHVLSMSPVTNSNPWFRKYWSERFNCSLTDTACVTENNVTSLPAWGSYTYASNAFDAVLTYAHAIDAVIKSRCPHRTGSDVRSCISGPDLLAAMRNSSFYGSTGLIEYDAKGSVLAKFTVEQLDNDGLDVVPVAVYYARTAELTYFRNISFDYVIQEGLLKNGIPRSVCSLPCGPGEFVIKKDQVCCWECRRCRNNEILVRDNTDCNPCPDFTWPDVRSNYTSCYPIEPDYPEIGDPLVVFCLTLSVAGVVGVAMVIVAYAKHSDAKVIKASSKELSSLQLFAVLTGYLTMPVLNVKPTDGVCVASYFMYCLSFTWLYAPLLVKTIRIHRIFHSGKKSKGRVKLISPRSQIVFSALLITIQFILCIAMTFLYKPSASLTQVVKTENDVELSCNWTLPGLTSFLAYNLVLVVLCSVFAFKTRKLPDNFNESRFISLCVYTTLIIWLAFIPTYFTAGRQYLKTLLLSLSLLVNHTVALVFLYVPKIYAAVNLIPTTSNVVGESINTTSRLDTIATTASSSRVQSANVYPSGDAPACDTAIFGPPSGVRVPASGRTLLTG